MKISLESNMNFWDWRRLLKLWGRPLAGIAGMLLLGRLFEVAYFFLFVHHLFWIFAVMLLLNPLSETFWPSAELKKKKSILPQSLPNPGRGQQRANVWKRRDTHQ